MQTRQATMLLVLGLVAGTFATWFLFRPGAPHVVQPLVYLHGLNVLDKEQPSLSVEEFHKLCPGMPLTGNKDRADYLVGVDEDSLAVVRLHPLVSVLQVKDSKQSKTEHAKLACEAVKRDFASWVHTEQARGLAAKPEIVDSPQRYSLQEYRHGNIVGLALVDQQVGRVWLLTKIREGKESRDEFHEAAVAGLWEDPEHLEKQTLSSVKDEAIYNFFRKTKEEDRRTKELTLPLGIQRAREKTRH